MPLYEYECPTHGRFEVSQRITEDALKTCITPKCRKAVKKLISNTSFALKGTGWYQSDYGGKSGSGSLSTPEPKAAATTESSSETKAEAKTETKAEVKTEAKAEKKAEKKTEPKPKKKASPTPSAA